MIGYWCVVVLMLASVMASCGYEFRQGVFLSTTMLPGMFCAKLSLPGALRASNRRAVAVAGVAGGILVIEWLALLLAHRYIWSGWLPGDGMVFHVLFYNPVFIGLLLAAVLIPERLLDRWIKARLPRMETVSFISERRKVTLPVGELLYVESNDTEVFLHTADGGLYPTRTGFAVGAFVGRSVHTHPPCLAGQCRAGVPGHYDGCDHRAGHSRSFPEIPQRRRRAFRTA